MIKLYLDFDGVILDTIDAIYSKANKANKNTQKEIREYCSKLNWEELINNCNQINNSITNIKKIINSNLYDVTILTHIITNHEKIAKQNYIRKELGNVNIITVDINDNKCDVVECENAILVDDYTKNLDSWSKKGGIAIKFSDKGRKSKYMSISNLAILLDKYSEIKTLIANNKYKKLLINK